MPCNCWRGMSSGDGVGLISSFLFPNRNKQPSYTPQPTGLQVSSDQFLSHPALYHLPLSFFPFDLAKCHGRKARPKSRLASSPLSFSLLQVSPPRSSHCPLPPRRHISGEKGLTDATGIINTLSSAMAGLVANMGMLVHAHCPLQQI